MSRWRHALCESCWTARNPNRPAHRIEPAALERCCGCGAQTDAGIYVREDPYVLPCRGVHE